MMFFLTYLLLSTYTILLEGAQLTERTSRFLAHKLKVFVQLLRGHCFEKSRDLFLYLKPV